MQYFPGITSASTNQIGAKLNIVNGGAVSVPLADLKVRYWFTATADDVTSPLVFECDYAAVGQGNITSSFGAASGMNADHYLEVGFLAGAGSIAAGANSGEVQARIHSSNFQNFIQTNDYSFDPTKTSFQDAITVTLYASGTLIWGTEPP